MDNPGLHSDLTPTAEALRQRYEVSNSTCISDPGAQLFSREIGVVVHQPPHPGVGGRTQVWPLAASMGARRDVPGRAATA